MSEDRNVIEIYRAKNGFQARRFVDALEKAGIRAEVQGDFFNPPSQVFPSLISDTGPWWDAPRILVFAEDAHKAKRLLLQWERTEKERNELRKNEHGPTMEVLCEECGKANHYPIDQRGSVQDCKHCGEWVDVENQE